MGFCIADSLIVCNGYNGSDIRVRFHNWWSGGDNNAFRNDKARGERSSVGWVPITRRAAPVSHALAYSHSRPS